MDSHAVSILCDEFTRLPNEEQAEEIGNLFILAGGIEITRKRNETDEEFKNRAFSKGLNNLSEESKLEVFKNIMIPSLIYDFKESSIDTKEKLLDKLMGLSDERPLRRNSREGERRYLIRSYSEILQKIPATSLCKMVRFVSGANESENEEESNDQDDDESTPPHRRSYLISRRVISDSDSSEDEYKSDPESIEEGESSDGSNKVGFTKQRKLKANRYKKVMSTENELSGEDESNDDEDEDGSTSTRSHRSHLSGPKADLKNYTDEDEYKSDTESMEEGGKSDGSTKVGFNKQRHLKAHKYKKVMSNENELSGQDESNDDEDEDESTSTRSHWSHLRGRKADSKNYSNEGSSRLSYDSDEAGGEMQ